MTTATYYDQLVEIRLLKKLMFLFYIPQNNHPNFSEVEWEVLQKWYTQQIASNYIKEIEV